VLGISQTAERQEKPHKIWRKITFTLRFHDGFKL
jgi:hypothetical protein